MKNTIAIIVIAIVVNINAQNHRKVGKEIGFVLGSYNTAYGTKA